MSIQNYQYSLNEFKRMLSEIFKNCLEEKHLYQNCNIDLNKTYLPDKEVTNKLWEPIIKLQPTTRPNPMLQFILPTIKIYCAKCNRIEAYNPFNTSEDKENFVLFSQVTHEKVVQLFILTYQCQSCKGFPETFIIRRENLKLIVSGRSPMETVTSPSFIPKSHNKYYSNAKIAFNSGQILAGLFFLRVFIEQYTKSIIGNEDPSLKADEIIDLYMEKLPQDFKSRFPSLKEIYSALSKAIHLADESVELFNQSINDVNKHFDAKRLFSINF